jgi:hypothetical protein
MDNLEVQAQGAVEAGVTESGEEGLTLLRRQLIERRGGRDPRLRAASECDETRYPADRQAE